MLTVEKERNERNERKQESDTFYRQNKYANVDLNAKLIEKSGKKMEWKKKEWKKKIEKKKAREAIVVSESRHNTFTLECQFNEF